MRPSALVMFANAAYFAVLVEWRLCWCRLGRLFAAAAAAALFFGVTHYAAALAFAGAHGLDDTSIGVLRVALSVLRAELLLSECSLRAWRIARVRPAQMRRPLI